MKIVRSINNNIVTALDDDGQEVIVTGRGIGFKAKEGAAVPPEKVLKVYRMSTQNETDRLKELFAALPPEYIELTDEIFGFAKRMLHKNLHESAYITLADHIHFAVQRHGEGMDFQNILHAEVRRFYPTEYAIGKYALEVIHSRLGVQLLPDEAASIAMHLLNAEYDISVSDTFSATKLLDQVVELVKERTGLVMDDSNYYCERFITHLKFLAQRVIKKEPLPAADDGFYSLIAAQYPTETECGLAVARYIEETYHYAMSSEEICGLAIHIRRIGMGTEPQHEQPI